MDEYVKLEFESRPGSAGISDLEHYFECQLLTRVPADRHAEHHGEKRVLIYDFTEIDEAGLDEFFARATQADVRNTVVTVGSRGTGRTVLFANPGGGVELFVSTAELETARGAQGDGRKVGREGAGSPQEPGTARRASTGDSAKKPVVDSGGSAAPSQLDIGRQLSGEPPLTLDFGRRGDANTLVVRLHVAERKRRMTIAEMFRSLEDFRTPKLIKAFEAQFASCGTGVRWPGYFGSDEAWHWGPDNLLDGFLFAVDNGEYVYLAFDMANINRDQTSMENFLAIFLPSRFGTDGVWAKLTTVSGLKEKFFFEEDGEIRAMLRERTEDSDWKHPA